MITSIKIPDAERSKSVLDQTLGFMCKCGCDLFRVEVSTYKNGDWSEELICVQCQAVNAVTEPVMNGPH